MRLRHLWHMWCSQGRRADLEVGTSSSRQITHATLLVWVSVSTDRGFVYVKPTVFLAWVA